jgi:hypothetical protein
MFASLRAAIRNEHQVAQPSIRVIIQRSRLFEVKRTSPSRVVWGGGDFILFSNFRLNFKDLIAA